MPFGGSQVYWDKPMKRWCLYDEHGAIFLKAAITYYKQQLPVGKIKEWKYNYKHDLSWYVIAHPCSA